MVYLIIGDAKLQTIKTKRHFKSYLLHSFIHLMEKKKSYLLRLYIYIYTNKSS